MPVCMYTIYIAQKWEKIKRQLFFQFFLVFGESIFTSAFWLCKSEFLYIILPLDIENQSTIIINTNNKKTCQAIE